MDKVDGYDGIGVDGEMCTMQTVGLEKGSAGIRVDCTRSTGRRVDVQQWGCVWGGGV